LLDTQIVLWWALGDSRLKPRIHALIADADEVHVSAASVWEAEVKAAAGRLRLDVDLSELCARSGWNELAIRFPHARAAARLPRHHSDPFDRMLIAQAQSERLRLVSADPLVTRYDVPVEKA
jgi:PIN domain nuclease of toxin-antitoxin system